MSLVKSKLTLLVVFLAAIILRLYPALNQPLWQDEYYSLYFSTRYTVKQLLFGLPDVHQGGYYVLLKLLLMYTINPFLLRLVSSIIPQLVAGIVIYRLSKNSLLTAIVLFNPFLIYTGWSLRMYGITTLLSAILLHLFYTSKFLPSVKHLLLFSLISTFFSFSFVIPIFCLCLYCYYKTKNKAYLFIPLTAIFQFLAFKGFGTYRQYTEKASWISPPTFSNSAGVVLTTLGFTSQTNRFDLPLIVSLPATILIWTFFIKQKTPHFHLLFTLPLLLTIFISTLLPFLSARFFFYKFTPHISVFFPRFLLPLTITFYYTIFNHLKNRKLAAATIITTALWFIPYYHLNITPSTPIQDNISTNQIQLPPWLNFQLPANFSRTDLNKLISNYNQSLEIESKIINFNGDCSVFKGYPSITFSDKDTVGLDSYQNLLKSTIDQCHLTAPYSQSPSGR